MLAAAYRLCRVLSVWTPQPRQADTTPAGLVQTEPMKGWGRGDVTLDGARLGPGLATQKVF